MPTIEDQLRFFAVRVNNGSGCLFQPDTNEYTYVLTVKHNLEIENGDGKKVLMPLDDIQIYRNNVAGAPISDIIACEPHETLDLALIIIPYIGDTEMALTHSFPVKEEPIFLYGYPKRLSALAEKREDVSCFCSMQREDKFGTEIRTEQGQHTWDINTQTAMVGFSGCGVFANINGILVLKGIFPELKDPTGANNKLTIFYASNFDSIADKLGYKRLLPTNLLSFTPYIGKVFHGLDHHLKQCMANNLNNVITGSISPIIIAEERKETLLVPTSEKYTDSFIST